MIARGALFCARSTGAARSDPLRRLWNVPRLGVEFLTLRQGRHAELLAAFLIEEIDARAFAAGGCRDRGGDRRGTVRRHQQRLVNSGTVQHHRQRGPRDAA